jgi:hypothetical protein
MRRKVAAKMDAIHFVKVEQEGKHGVLVKFQDGTITAYVVEELIVLRPNRGKKRD